MYVCVCVYVCSDKETQSKRPESRFGMRGVFANSSLERLYMRSYTSTITEIILHTGTSSRDIQGVRGTSIVLR